MSVGDRIVAVVGPTASGKSSLAVDLARRMGSAEVVNADSMQLYRGMDIGTAKPTPAERAGVPHHLLDLWHVREPASVAEYRQRARLTEELTAVGAAALHARLTALDPAAAAAILPSNGRRVVRALEVIELT